MPSHSRSALIRRCELIALLARKEWHIRYRSAKLGYAWAVLQPFMLMVVLLVMFDYVTPYERKPYPETNPYPIFLLSGLFPWHFTSVAFSSATPSFPNSRKLILLASFPRDVLPLGVVAAHLVNLLLTLPLLIPLYVLYGTAPSWWILALPIPILLQTVIVGGLSLIAALACVRFTDTFFLVQALLLPWFYATPIFYPASLVPERWRLLYGLNPMVGVVEGFRWALLGTDTGPDLMFWISVGISLMIFVTGLFYFRSMEKTFADTI
jgi:lipopolysaccharide transport system permease protein